MNGKVVDKMSLSLTGACVPVRKEAVSELKFVCATRKSDTKTITIENDSERDWNLKPQISNTFWTGRSSVRVPRKGRAEYEVKYEPLLMTKKGESHQGSLFIALPNGSAKVFTLLGTAGEPDVEETIESKAITLTP